MLHRSLRWWRDNCRVPGSTEACFHIPTDRPVWIELGGVGRQQNGPDMTVHGAPPWYGPSCSTNDECCMCTMAAGSGYFVGMRLHGFGVHSWRSYDHGRPRPRNSSFIRQLPGQVCGRSNEALLAFLLLKALCGRTTQFALYHAPHFRGASSWLTKQFAFRNTEGNLLLRASMKVSTVGCLA